MTMYLFLTLVQNMFNQTKPWLHVPVAAISSTAWHISNWFGLHWLMMGNTALWWKRWLMMHPSLKELCVVESNLLVNISYLYYEKCNFRQIARALFNIFFNLIHLFIYWQNNENAIVIFEKYYEIFLSLNLIYYP